MRLKSLFKKRTKKTKFRRFWRNKKK